MENYIATLVISLIVGIVSGLIASYLFLFHFLKNKVPKINISENISKDVYDNELNYFFKFINVTDSETFDVRIEATLYKPFGDKSGKNLRGKDINLVDDFASFVAKEKNTDTHNLHAMRVRTTDNLEELWIDESSFIRLTVIAKHALSGFNKVFYKDFYSKDCISSKKFISGNSLDVS